MAKRSVQADRRGIYNVEYFSGAQAAVYIGDVWVDEITSISYGVQQGRSPLYGYADTYFRDVSEGQVLVQGSFSINFKEAGYLFLVLDRWRKQKGYRSLLQPFFSSSTVIGQNIERAINGELTFAQKRQLYRDMSKLAVDVADGSETGESRLAQRIRDKEIASTSRSIVGSSGASLRGFASNERDSGGIGTAENLYEAFEDKVWSTSQAELDVDSRRPDHAGLNPFDIYVTFGDFAGDNSVNHTVQKLSNVYILGSSKQVVIDGQPIQEVYSFIARNLV